MPGPVTDNFQWQLPEVDGDEGTWGDVLNAVLAAVDSDLQTVEDTADAALSLGGGQMSGRVDVLTSTIAATHEGSVTGVKTLDIAVSNYHTAIVTGITTFIFGNVPSGNFASGFVLRLTNAGAFGIVWPASVKWPGGVAPVLTISGVDILVFLTDDDGTTWRGVVSGKDIR